MLITFILCLKKKKAPKYMAIVNTSSWQLHTNPSTSNTRNAGVPAVICNLPV